LVNKRFRLNARVSSSNPQAVRTVLEKFITKGSVEKAQNDFIIEAEMEAADARKLNRSLLSALRKVEKKTRLRAEWTSDDGTTQIFFDYVLKKTIKN
jgi:hypothetical protein